MTWQADSFPGLFSGYKRPHIGTFSVNEECFIRKGHRCGKIFGASKSCFIACPTLDELEPILNLMSEKLSKASIETVIAVKERAYGQDIFCTKICGRIIESRFCVVILDDTIVGYQNIPNPNVYYEYGLMTSLRKHIIPLQKEGLKLAFNIQSYDTIKYTSKNLATELDRAIRDAIQITESTDRKPQQTSLADKAIFRKLELAGFEAKDNTWFLAPAISDTTFRAFAHRTRGFYVYLGKLDNNDDLVTYLEDLAVTVYRTEKTADELKANLVLLQPPADEPPIAAEARASHLATQVTPYPLTVPGTTFFQTSFVDTTHSAEDIAATLNLMQTFYFAFIVNDAIDIKDFASKAATLISPHPRYKLVLSDSNGLAFGDLKVPLADITH